MRPQRLSAGKAPKLVRDLVVLAGGQLATKVIAVAAFAVLARTLDPERYGVVEYMVGLAVFLAMAIDCGLGPIGVRRVAQSRTQLPLLATQIPLARMGVALITIPIMVIGLMTFGPAGVPGGLVWLLAASLLLAPLNQDWLLQSAELMAQVALGHMLRALVFAAAVLLLVRGPADVVAVGWAELAAAVVACFYYLAMQHFKVTPIRLSFSTPHAIGLIREGAAVGLSTFVWAAAQYMPLFLIGSLVGGAQVGWYAAAQRLGTSISMFGFVYHFNLYPALARSAAGSNSEFSKLLRTSFRVTAWGSIGLALGLMLAAEPVLTVIFGERFSVAATSLQILVWGIPVMFLSGHARGALIVISAQKYVLYAQIAGLATVVLAGVPLVSFFGEVGAAAAAVASSIVVWISSHVSAVKLAAPLPRLALIVKPLMLAVVSGIAARYMDMSPLANALGGIALYSIAAPILDRTLVPDLINLAHAKEAVLPPAAP